MQSQCIISQAKPSRFGLQSQTQYCMLPDSYTAVPNPVLYAVRLVFNLTIFSTVSSLELQVLLSATVVLGVGAIAIALLCILRRRQARRGRGGKWISLTPLTGKPAQQ